MLSGPTTPPSGQPRHDQRRPCHHQDRQRQHWHRQQKPGSGQRRHRQLQGSGQATDATNTQDQQTISNLQGQLSVQDEVPPGGYAAFQDQLLEGLSSQYSVSASTVDCVLPSTWTPGDQFNCDTFDSNSNYMGNSTITIESNAPDGSPAWEYNWNPADSGFGDD